VVTPPVRVRPESDAVTPASTWKTRLDPPPLMASLPGPRIVTGPVASLSSSGPAVRAMTARLANVDLSKVMVAPPLRTSARWTAWRRLS
jgi:hypothetical protein